MLMSFLSSCAYVLGTVILVIGWPLAGIVGAIPFFAVGYALDAPARKRKRQGLAYYQELLQRDPYAGQTFNVSTTPQLYSEEISLCQAQACAHYVARELSIEFLGLTVYVVSGPEDTKVPRRVGLGKSGWPCRKKADEPLDTDELRFRPTLQKLKLRGAAEAKGNRLPEVDKENRDFPQHGTTKHEGDTFLRVTYVFDNQVKYFNGKLFITREWRRCPPVLCLPSAPYA
jgi:hypothetical protein